MSVVVAAKVIVDCRYKNCTSQRALGSSKEVIKTFAAGEVIWDRRRVVFTGISQRVAESVESPHNVAAPGAPVTWPMNASECKC